ncbi:MAG: patatin-like phospholipase family protein [Bradymonadia bacterium]
MGNQSPKCGLVLSGGGARGAYEAGIAYYLFVDGPAELRESARFSVLSGTSIGALSVSAIASTIHQPAVGMRQFSELWRSLTLERILQLKLSDVVSMPGWLMGRTQREAIFPGEPVRQILEDAIDWDQMHVNLANGLVDAISLSATQVPTGKSVVFYETSDGRPRKFSRDPHVRPVHARLKPEHALASAAIPFVFPPTPIDGIPYVDGGLRQNTPLSPALRLGSDRLLVVGLGTGKSTDGPLPKNVKASPVNVLAKVLNALMLDHVDYDLIRLGHVNRLLSDGEDVFGGQFIERLNHMVAPIRGAKYRIMPHVVLRPSRDLGVMAAQHVKEKRMRSTRSLIARVVRTLARMEGNDEADLVSYLLFDGPYCEKLMSLGIEDARAKTDDLIRLFCD